MFMFKSEGPKWPLNVGPLYPCKAFMNLYMVYDLKTFIRVHFVLWWSMCAFGGMFGDPILLKLLLIVSTCWNVTTIHQPAYEGIG